MRNENKDTNFNKDKWVINLSSRSLSSPETSVLERGLNFAPTPKEIPVVDIITETEYAIKRLQYDKNSCIDENSVAELRARVTWVLKSAKPPKSNITKEERDALSELRKDNKITILPADKGRATVVLDADKYDQKVSALLEDTNTYVKLQKDPTKCYQTKLIKLLKEFKTEGNLSEAKYAKLYPTSCGVPSFYGLPKVHKAGTPLRPIVSSINSVTYECASYLADILGKVIGKSEHHILNTEAFVNRVKDLKVEPEEILISYDVSALFTSIPVDSALEAVKIALEEEQLERDN